MLNMLTKTFWLVLLMILFQVPRAEAVNNQENEEPRRTNNHEKQEAHENLTRFLFCLIRVFRG